MHGPGQIEVCKECLAYIQREQDIEHQIVNKLEEHPEIMNGCMELHDLMKLRRGSSGNSHVRRDYPYSHGEGT